MKRLLRLLILTLVHIAGAPGVISAQRRLRQRTVQSPRILLLRPDHLGDLIMTTPVLQALRDHAPDAQITLMVGPWSREVVARHPAIDAIITCAFPGFQRAAQGALEPYLLLLKTARTLRRGNYDLAINLRPDFWWGAALLYLAGVPRRVGYAIDPGTPFLTRALPFPPAEHATISNLRLASTGLQALGLVGLDEPYTPEQYPLVFTPTSEERAWVDARMQSVDISPTTPVVVIHPGTGGAVKLWRTRGWASIADALAGSSLFATPPRIVLTGSPGERELLEEIAHAMQDQPLLVTDATVGQLAALLGRARLVLGVDNGPLHLATAQNIPTLRLFGPTDARIFGPWGSLRRHRILASQQKCASCPMIPCGRLDFRPDELAAHPCVRLITDQQVMQAITQLMGEQVKTGP